jgi:hypothetical protein
MGNEVKGAVRAGDQRHQGKILLETSEIIFRGADFRLRIPFAELCEVAASDGELRVKTKSGVTVFEVGGTAEKWREKILHPKTRAEKLGVKAGTRVLLAGAFDADFVNELKANKSAIVRNGGSSSPEITFLAVAAKRSLAAIAKHARKTTGAQALWVVYPKGKKEITEVDIISAGRKTGLKDVKVVGFSATYTALKFVVPVAKRLARPPRRP